MFTRLQILDSRIKAEVAEEEILDWMFTLIVTHCLEKGWVCLDSRLNVPRQILDFIRTLYSRSLLLLGVGGRQGIWIFWDSTGWNHSGLKPTIRNETAALIGYLKLNSSFSIFQQL